MNVSITACKLQRLYDEADYSGDVDTCSFENFSVSHVMQKKCHASNLIYADRASDCLQLKSFVPCKRLVFQICSLKTTDTKAHEDCWLAN